MIARASVTTAAGGRCVRISTAALASIVLASTFGCGGDAGPTDASTGTSFGRLQAKVFATSCNFAACHAAENTSGSGLVLAGTGAYGALVGMLPRQANARADGLRLVTPGKPDSSLLWHKVNGFVSGHHARDYGAPMPFVGQPLPAGQVEFIRQWIAGGASATDDQIDPALLNGTVTQLTYTPLSPPANGFQVRMPAFAIPGSAEREVFVYTPVGNGQDTWVNRIQTNMRTGSHHFVVYTFAPNTPPALVPLPGQVRDLKDGSGTFNFATLAAMGYHVFFAGTQSATSDFTFPPGVAIRLPAGAMLDVNSHYVNSATTPATGEAEANLHVVPATQVQFEAQALNLAHTDLALPIGRDTTIRKTFTFSRLTRVVMLTSHMHKRGLRFVIRIAGGPRAGQVVYESTAWDHPPITTFSAPLTLNAGEGLTSEVTYRGDPSRIVRFGLTADDEMDIIFGYWY
jgi:hypothetical protein